MTDEPKTPPQPTPPSGPHATRAHDAHDAQAHPAHDANASHDAALPIDRVTLSAGDIAYLSQGDRDAPLVVLAHGFPDHPTTFLPLMARLCAAGYRCVAPFSRGYAPSTLEGPFDHQRIGDDLAELVDALSPNAPATIVGHDWGAAATYTAVGRWPQRFRKAVTLAVPHVSAFEKNLRGSRSQQLRSAYMAFCMLPLIPERVIARNDFAYVDAIWKRWSPGYTPDPDHLRVVKTCLQASMPGPLGHYRALRPSRERLRQARLDSRVRIYVPLLHLHGADDGCISFDMSAGEEKYFNAEFHSENLPGLGHFLHLEDPQRVAAAILDFIGPARALRRSR